MTLVDRPLIQYAIDEARAAGIKEFIFVTSRAAKARSRITLRPCAPSWKERCAAPAKEHLLELLKQSNMESGAIAYVRQHRALGLGMRCGAPSA